MKKIKFIAKGLFFLMIVLFIPVLVIGGVLEYRRDIKAFSSLPVLKLKIPSELKKAETGYMVAFVHPAYEQKMAEQHKQWQQAYDALLEARGVSSGTAYRKVDVAKISYADSIKKYLQTDLEQILLAKNIRVLDVFKTRDEMTFDQKKRAIYTFTPEISITAEPKIRKTEGESGAAYTEEGEVIVSGEVIFTLRESITGEKVWVKRMDAGPITKPYKFVAQYKETYRQTVEADLCATGCVGPPAPKPMKPTVKEEDNSAEALAAALSVFYASLNDQLVKHIDSEEWEKYLGQAEKLRQEKRY